MLLLMGVRRVWVAVTVAVIGGSIAGCGTTARGGPAVIRVAPSVGLYDVARSIVVSHLAPGESITITATTPRPQGTWSATATYVANSAGVVDLARAAPRSGSYHGVAALGLLWSQHFVRAGSTPTYSRVTTLTVTSGHRRIASADVTQLLLGPGVAEHRDTIAKAGFFGQYFVPTRPGRHPAVIVWGGPKEVSARVLCGRRCSPPTGSRLSRSPISMNRDFRARSRTSRSSTSSRRFDGCAPNPRSNPSACGS